jgi:hypothetical protein
MKFKIKDHIKNGDIVINIEETYPDFILDMKRNNVYDEDLFFTYLYQNDFSFIAYHCTRLTDFEISEIKSNGMAKGGKELLRNKIMCLPKSCDDIREELLNHIDGLRETQADSSICVSFGNLDLVTDKACDKIFTQFWGGESIYNFYDNTDSFTSKRLQYIKNKLQLISTPCIILLRCPKDAQLALSYTYYYEKFMEQNIDELFGSMCIKNCIPEVLDIIDLTKYSGLDFS